MSPKLSPSRNPGAAAVSPPARHPGRAAWICAWVAGGCLLGGCAAPRYADLVPDHPSANVYLYADELPLDLRRVAVLPLACEEQRPDLQDGCEALDPVLQSELVKTRKFEVVCLSPKDLWICSGRSAWTGTEVMPREILNSLHGFSGCDAVLFCQLTAFRAYEPMVIGWRLRLVNAQTGQTLWAVDELIDAAQLPVREGSTPLQWLGLSNPGMDMENWRLRNSPQQFGQFAAVEVLATLPRR